MLKLYPEYSSKLTGNAIRDYIYGGRGVVTLKSPTGVHHTYMFNKPRNEDIFPSDVLFVYAVHDGHKLFYVGMVEDDYFRLTRHSRFDNHTEIVKGARYIMKMMHYPNMETPMELYHQGICAVCGRPLTNPKSIERGMGPACRKRLSC